MNVRQKIFIEFLIFRCSTPTLNKVYVVYFLLPFFTIISYLPYCTNVSSDLRSIQITIIQPVPFREFTPFTLSLSQLLSIKIDKNKNYLFHYIFHFTFPLIVCIKYVNYILFFAEFCCKILAFLRFFAGKTLKMTNSTSVWRVQHPNAV